MLSRGGMMPIASRSRIACTVPRWMSSVDCGSPFGARQLSRNS
jgi:hypothetical protein